MKIRGKKRYIIIGVILLIFVFLGIQMSKGGALLGVETVAAKTGNVESILSISGTVREKNNYEVFSEQAVKVKKVYVEKNDEVKKGDRILELDLDSLNSSLNTLKINRDIQKLNYEKASISDANGSLSLVSTQNSTEQAKDAFYRAEALYDVGAISKVEYDSAKTAYENAKAGLSMAQKATNNDLEIMKKQIELSEIQINDMQKQISKLQACMVSPSNGFISKINVVEGGFASPGMALYEIINNDELEIVSNVKEFTVKNLSVGQQVYITGDAFEGKTYNGYIKSIAGVAEQTVSAMNSGTVIEVVTAITDENTELKSGLNVTCDVIINKKENVLTIPVSAFKEEKEGNTYAFIIEESMLKQIPIEIGINSDTEIEVISGINEGQKVVETIKSIYTTGMKVQER